jgi:hypothetical protein
MAARSHGVRSSPLWLSPPGEVIAGIVQADVPLDIPNIRRFARFRLRHSELDVQKPRLRLF